MSDEQRKDEEAEVEAHNRSGKMTDEPKDEGENDNDVEAHSRSNKTTRHI
jgi:hypothetical protein